MRRPNMKQLIVVSALAGCSVLTGCASQSESVTITARQRVSIPAPGTIEAPMVASAPPTQVMLGATDAFGGEVYEYYLAHVNDNASEATQVAEVNTDH